MVPRKYQNLNVRATCGFHRSLASKLHDTRLGAVVTTDWDPDTVLYPFHEDMVDEYTTRGISPGGFTHFTCLPAENNIDLKTSQVVAHVDAFLLLENKALVVKTSSEHYLTRGINGMIPPTAILMVTDRMGEVIWPPRKTDRVLSGKRRRKSLSPSKEEAVSQVDTTPSSHQPLGRSVSSKQNETTRKTTINCPFQQKSRCRNQQKQCQNVHLSNDHDEKGRVIMMIEREITKNERKTKTVIKVFD